MVKIIIVCLIFITSPIFSCEDCDYREKPQKTSFRAWFSFGNKEKFENKARKHEKRMSSQMSNHMKVFDSYAIFDFDKEVMSSLSNTKKIQHDFKKNMKLLRVQITHVEQELGVYIKEQKEGKDRSKEILETYMLLFELCSKSFSMMDEHTETLNQLLKDTKIEYNQKIKEKINNAQTDPTTLVTELIKRYELTGNN